MEELGGGQEQVEGPGEDDDEKPQHEEEGREPEALEVSRPLLPRAPFSDSMLGVRPATGWRQVMEKRKAVERDLEHMDQLRATVIELQEVLEKEREKCRYVANRMRCTGDRARPSSCVVCCPSSS